MIAQRNTITFYGNLAKQQALCYDGYGHGRRLEETEMLKCRMEAGKKPAVTVPQGIEAVVRE